MAAQPAHTNALRAYTGAQWALAVTLAGLIAPVIFVMGMFLFDWANGASSPQPFSYLLLLPYALGFGLVIAWVCLSLPLLALMRRPLSARRAALWGAALGLALVSLYIALTSTPSQHPSQVGGGEHIQSINGIRTAYGWWIAAQQTLIFTAVTTLTALLLQRLLGPGQTPETQNGS